MALGTKCLRTRPCSRICVVIRWSTDGSLRALSAQCLRRATHVALSAAPSSEELDRDLAAAVGARGRASARLMGRLVASRGVDAVLVETAEAALGWLTWRA